MFRVGHHRVDVTGIYNDEVVDNVERSDKGIWPQIQKMPRSGSSIIDPLSTLLGSFSTDLE